MNSPDLPLQERIAGAILGLALGDACGAPHEGGLPERLLWRLIGRRGGRQRWTDDTQMTIDVLQSLLGRGCIDPDDLARRFAASWRWSRGYGPGASQVLRRIRRGQPWTVANRSVHPEGSLGNGGAMRAPTVGLFLFDADDEAIMRGARAVAQVTHAHPLGQEGAALVALATAHACRGLDAPQTLARLRGRAASTDFARRLQRADEWLQDGAEPEPRTVARELGNGIAAAESCVTAIYLGLRFRDAPFERWLDFAIRLRGDVDTIAAMTGAIWGAANGLRALPAQRLQALEQVESLAAMAQALADAVRRRPRDRVAGA